MQQPIEQVGLQLILLIINKKSLTYLFSIKLNNLSQYKWKTFIIYIQIYTII
jgi:hypothetical protein